MAADNDVQKHKFLPLSLRVETLGGIATPLVLRGTPLPARRSETFSTAADRQSSVAVELLMGESPLARNDIKMGTFHLNEIPPAAKGETSILVEFSVDETCRVTARASVMGLDLASEHEFVPPNPLTDDFVRKQLAQAEATRAADDAELLRVEAINRANSLIAEAEQELQKESNSKLNEALANLGLALASGNSDDIREKSNALAMQLTHSKSPFDFDFGSFFGAPATKVKVAQAPTKKQRSAPQSERLAASSAQHQLGKVFGSGTFIVDPQLCFVLMPFDSKFKPLYDDNIRPVIERAGLRCERADDIHGTNIITWDIWERINRARFLVAELTEQNANVFYELGIAHALSKDVILITRSRDFVPFDLKTIRCLVYEYTPRGIQDFEKKLAATIDALVKSA